MPDWNTILDEINRARPAHDRIRRKYLKNLHEVTGRNVVIYYSGWLQKESIARNHPNVFAITDSDMHGLMAALKGLDRSLGLDLVLHTPGGSLAATESIVNYLRGLYKDIRAIVPQIAMSGGTMMSLACKEIVMDKHSSLGPIYPQFGGAPAGAIVEEFDQALKKVSDDPKLIPVYQIMLSRLDLVTINEARKALEWSEEITREWLLTGMFRGLKTQDTKANRVLKEFSDRPRTKSHSRHISADKAKDVGVKIKLLEKEQQLQDAVLSVHHSTIQTLAETSAVKIIENQNGIAHVTRVQPNS